MEDEPCSDETEILVTVIRNKNLFIMTEVKKLEIFVHCIMEQLHLDKYLTVISNNCCNHSKCPIFFFKWFLCYDVSLVLKCFHYC